MKIFCNKFIFFKKIEYAQKTKKYSGISLYVRVADNPLRLIDKDGEKVVNPQNQVLGNTEIVKALAQMNENVILATELKDEDFNIVITGGDRVKNDKGEYIEIATGIVIKDSKAGTDHLAGNGSAVDISTKESSIGNKKVNVQILINAAKKAGFYKSGSYKDGHLHLELEQSKADKKYYKENTVPFVDYKKEEK